MDDNHFDNLVRAASAPSSRRSALCALAGGLLAALSPTTSAGKAKRGKKKGKRPKSCAERCGGRCHARCPDAMTKCGQICIGQDRCCPGEKTCGGGCIREEDCCSLTERECPNGICVSKDACCPIIETECGAECCVLGARCCNGECGGAPGDTCTKDGWCPVFGAQPCCAGSGVNCPDGPCCRFSEGEACCVTNLDPIETTCCPGGVAQCARGGCCPAGTEWVGDCEACCTRGTRNCTSCTGAVSGRG